MSARGARLAGAGALCLSLAAALELAGAGITSEEFFLDRRDLGYHDGEATGIAFSADGRALASCGADGSLRVWDVSRPDVVPEGKAIQAHSGSAAGVAFLPNGRLLTGGHDALLRLWEADGRMAAEIAAGPTPVRGLAVSYDGSQAAAAMEDGSVRVWRLARLRRRPLVLKGHRGAAYTVAFSADGLWLASGGDDGSVRLWDLSRRQARRVLRPGLEPVFAVLFSTDGARLYAAGVDRSIRGWTAADGRLVTELNGHSQAVRGLALFPDGITMASAGMDGIRFWDLETGMEKSLTAAPPDAAAGAAVAPDARSVAAAGLDGGVRLYLLKGGIEALTGSRR